MLYVSCAILGLNLLILFTIFGMAVTIRNHSGLEKTNIFKKGFTLVLVLYQTFLSMPVFDVLIRSLVSASEDNIALAFKITTYLISSLGILTLALIMLYIA